MNKGYTVAVEGLENWADVAIVLNCLFVFLCGGIFYIFFWLKNKASVLILNYVREIKLDNSRLIF